MLYFYSAAAMGFGYGRWWHGLYNFPNYTRVTKTLTAHPKKGRPYAVLPTRNSVFNWVGLHNPGILPWIWDCGYKNNRIKHPIIVSIAGTDIELQEMVKWIGGCRTRLKIVGVELNFSCPNAPSYNNKFIPKTSLPIYLKLNYSQDPYKYDLNNVAGIRLNSVPIYKGGGSGAVAKDKNWGFIKQFAKELSVAGCSFRAMDDIRRLEDMGCEETGIGSIIITRPTLVENLRRI